MKYVFILCLLVPVGAIAQISFEKGYLIDLDGKKTECLIRNADWLRTPEVVRYKLTENGDVITATVSEIKEFGVGNSRFLKAEIRMDTSSQHAKNYSDKRAPQWKDVVLFLRVLVDGKASLYQFDNGSLKLFFFSIDGSPIEQLVFKHYTFNNPRAGGRKQVVINKEYANQLVNQILCGEKPILTKMRYQTDYLTRYFVKYNRCSGVSFTQQQRGKAGNKIHLRLTPGIDWATGKTTDAYPKAYPSRTQNWRPAFEIEAELPFNKRKWSLILEPAYQSYDHEDFALNYSSVEILIGPRHYFFLTKNIKMFLNAGAVADYALTLETKSKRSVAFAHEFNKLNICVAGGAGISLGRFSLEARYYTPRRQTAHSGGLRYDYKKATLILGVRVF